MLKEIKVNKMLNLQGKQYFILSVYFVNTRILLDMLTDFQPIQSNEEYRGIPQTFEEHLLFNIKNEPYRKSLMYDLKVNGQLSRMTARNNSQFDGITYMRGVSNIKIPEELKGKPFGLVKFEFEPFEIEEDISQISLIQKDSFNQYVIKQEHKVPLHLNNDFEFCYADPETMENRFLYIKEFFIEPIEENRRNLFGVNENESLLCASVEFDESIAEINLMTKDKIKQGINYTHAPMIIMQPITDVKRSGYKGLKMPIGFTYPEQKEVDIVLFSIAKRVDMKEEISII